MSSKLLRSLSIMFLCSLMAGAPAVLLSRVYAAAPENQGNMPQTGSEQSMTTQVKHKRTTQYEQTERREEHAGKEEKQPHLKEALRLLERAKHQLSVAEKDKGGHREEALESVDKAIHQTKEGIEYDIKH